MICVSASMGYSTLPTDEISVVQRGVKICNLQISYKLVEHATVYKLLPLGQNKER
jgi:hypothetical protein